MENIGLFCTDFEMKPVRPNGKKSIHIRSLFDQKHFVWTLHQCIFWIKKNEISNKKKNHTTYLHYCLPKQ